MVDVSIIIVNYNLSDEISSLLFSIEKHVLMKNICITVVDNDSPDRSIKALVDIFPEVSFIFLEKNYGFGYANNIAAKRIKAKYYLFLNPDTLLIEDSVSKLYNFLEKQTDIGIAGPQLVYEDGEKQISGLGVPNFAYFFSSLLHLQLPLIKLELFIREKMSQNNYYEVGYVLGACFMIRKKLVDEVGLFDEDYFLFAEEEDLCIRVRKLTRYKIVFWKGTTVIHSKGKITNSNKAQRIKWLFESKLILLDKQYSFLKKELFSILIILDFIKWYLTAIIKNKNEKKELLKTYSYLIKYYLRGKPKVNEK